MSSALPASTIQRHGWHLGVLTLVLLGTIVLPATSGAQACPLPPQYTNSATVMVGDLQFTLATEKYQYAIGEPIALIMTVENTSAEPDTIPNPSRISPLYAFWIIPDTCASFYDDDCPVASPFIWPEAVYFWGAPTILGPSQCLTFTRTWSGTPWRGGTTASGLYTVVSGMSTGMGFFMPQDGVRVPIRIVEQGVPTERQSWGAIKALYR
jgi:hypothetical protein